jgi:sarcosine oxidase, subunit alpha
LRPPYETVVLATGFFSANELAFHATYKGSYILETSGNLSRIPHRREDMSVEDGLYVAGNAAGINDLEQALLEGEIAGLSAAISLGFGGGDAAVKREQARRALAAKSEG